MDARLAPFLDLSFLSLTRVRPMQDVPPPPHNTERLRAWRHAKVETDAALDDLFRRTEAARSIA